MAAVTLFAMHQYGRLDVMLLTAIGKGDCYFCRVKITESIIPPCSSKIYPLSVKFFVFFSFFRWYLGVGFSPTTQRIHLMGCSEAGPSVYLHKCLHRRV